MDDAKAQKNLNIPLFFGLLTIMNSLIKYGLYFVVVFSALAFGAAEDGKTEIRGRRSEDRGQEVRRARKR